MDKQVEKSVVVQGYVTALTDAAKDMEKNVKIAVVTSDGNKYVVTPKGAGNDLLEQINAKVTINGSLREQDGILYLTVRTYTLTDGFENEWYDDEF